MQTFMEVQEKALRTAVDTQTIEGTHLRDALKNNWWEKQTFLNNISHLSLTLLKRKMEANFDVIAVIYYWKESHIQMVTWMIK